MDDAYEDSSVDQQTLASFKASLSNVSSDSQLYSALKTTTRVERSMKSEKTQSSHWEQYSQGDEPEVIDWEQDDPEFPQNWSSERKAFILVSGILSVVNSTLGSSLPSNAIEYIALEFNVKNEQQLVLPISCYLMGYIIGPVICGPLSENYGRSAVFISTFGMYLVFTMACTIAPTWWSLLLFRLLCGLTASAPIAVVGGMFADIFGNLRKRGMAMALYMGSTALGPVLAPMISGYVAQSGNWRWVFGVGILFGMLTLPLIIITPETYAAVLLSRRAAKIRRDSGLNIIAKSDQQKPSLGFVITVVLTLPFRMLIQEVIVICVCAYSSLAYGVFYLYFEAYPVIFQGEMSVYGWSPGKAGLAFIPIGIGAICCAPIFYYWDVTVERARQQGKAWAKQEEYRRLPLACLGGPLYVISLFWLGWSARREVHWIVPVLSGIPFGAGFLLIFMALLNYLSDAYGTYSASALGIASFTRSIFGVLLPLAARRMFTKLGIGWAASLLGFVALGMALIPFAFIKYGDVIRGNSKFCQQLQAEKVNEDEED